MTRSVAPRPLRSKPRGGAGRAAWVAVLALAVAIGAVLVATPAAAHTPHDEIVDVAVSPDFDEDGTVYAIVRRYVLKSTDRGETWTRLVNGLDNRGQPSSVSVAPGNANIVYVSVRGGGVYRSSDAGQSWASVDGETGPRIVAFVEVSPHDPDIVVAAGVRAGEGAWLSRDGGSTWERLGAFESVASASFAHDDPGVLALAESTGAVHLSTDLGGRWDSAEVPLEGIDELKAVLVDARYQESEQIYVGTMLDGIWTSEDGGRSYARVAAGPSDPKIVDLLQTGLDLDQPVLWASTADEGVFLSADGAATWQAETDGLTTDEQARSIGRANFGQLSAAEPARDVEPTMFAASFDGLFRSDSRAAGWVNLATEISTNAVAISVSSDYANDSTVAVATYINGALLSTDGGSSWEPINDGLATKFDWERREDYVVRLLGIELYPSFPDDGMMQVGIRGYYVESQDRGRRWEAVLPDELIVPGEFPPDYFISAFSPNFEQDRTILMGTDGGRVFRYSGDADTIELIAEIGPEVTAMAISPGFAEDETVVAGTVEGVAVSTDGGVTWSEASLGGLAPQAATSLALSPDFASNGTAFAGSQIGLRVSRDFGATWEGLDDPVLGPAPPIEAVVISPPVDGESTMLVSVRGRGLFRSTDEGESFEVVAPELLENQVVFNTWYHPTSEPIVFSPTFAEDQTVFAIAENHVYRSSDAGESWETIEIPVTLHDVDVPPDQEFLAPTQGLAEAEGDGETAADAVGSDASTGRLSLRRVAAALGAGLGVFLLISLPVRRRRGGASAAVDTSQEQAAEPGRRMALVPSVALRLVAALGVTIVALIVLAA